MKIINLSEIVSITTSNPTEAEFFGSLDILKKVLMEPEDGPGIFVPDTKGRIEGNPPSILERAVKPVFPSSFQGPLTIVDATVTKENEIKGVVYPLINFKLTDGTNAILKIDIRALSRISKNFSEFTSEFGAIILVKDPDVKSTGKKVKVDKARVNAWKVTCNDALTQLLSDSGMFESTFIRVY